MTDVAVPHQSWDVGEAVRRHWFQYRGRDFLVQVTPDGGFELYYGGCLRKRRDAGTEPQYVWTNAELEWEDHHYVEVRYWASRAEISISINSHSFYSGPIAVVDS